MCWLRKVINVLHLYSSEGIQCYHEQKTKGKRTHSRAHNFTAHKMTNVRILRHSCWCVNSTDLIEISTFFIVVKSFYEWCACACAVACMCIGVSKMFKTVEWNEIKKKYIKFSKSTATQLHSLSFAIVKCLHFS